MIYYLLLLARDTKVYDVWKSKNRKDKENKNETFMIEDVCASHDTLIPSIKKDAEIIMKIGCMNKKLNMRCKIHTK